MYYSADIGVFGGSGLYELGDEYRRVDADTPYGKPSGAISLLDANGKKVAFMPRHGKGHIYSPAEVNYRANVDAMAQLGVKAGFRIRLLQFYAPCFLKDCGRRCKAH